MEELLMSLNKYINLDFPHGTIFLIASVQYWKYPEYNEITYQFSNDQIVTVAEFIKKLPLSWYHRESWGQDEIIWSQNCHPEEIFLIPGISWTHIYKWEEDEGFTVI